MCVFTLVKGVVPRGCVRLFLAQKITPDVAGRPQQIRLRLLNVLVIRPLGEPGKHILDEIIDIGGTRLALSKIAPQRRCIAARERLQRRFVFVAVGYVLLLRLLVRRLTLIPKWLYEV